MGKFVAGESVYGLGDVPSLLTAYARHNEEHGPHAGALGQLIIKDMNGGDMVASHFAVFTPGIELDLDAVDAVKEQLVRPGSSRRAELLQNLAPDMVGKVALTDTCADLYAIPISKTPEPEQAEANDAVSVPVPA